jgi:hypothetical protein
MTAEEEISNSTLIGFILPEVRRLVLQHDDALNSREIVG